MEEKNIRIANFLYEVGTMRKLARAHRQALLTDDMSDNIASHSYRVALIAWFIAKEEGVDPYKVVMMSLLHDVGETRSNDHNWIHKKYVKVFEKEIIQDQFGVLPFPELGEFVGEYEERKSKESLVAKDADLLEQVLLLREYELQGNKEAGVWLRGKDGEGNTQTKLLHFESSKKIGEALYSQNPSDWWSGLWTSANR
jgi:putative hydrolase of HD superfamily